MSLVTRLIVCRVKIVYPTFRQASIMVSEVLVREGHIDDKVRLMRRKSSTSCSHTVGIDSVC